MKKLTHILLIIISMASFSACKKDEAVYTPSASLIVANAVVGGGILSLNSLTTTVSNNNFTLFPMIAGNNQINLFVAATPSIPSVTYYNQALTLANSDNYSLFLGGASPTVIDAITIKESYTNYADSLCGVRFINLSPNSNPISINITGQPNGSEVTSLAYKAYSSFKQYPAKKANASYAFQIKDAGTGSTIASYTLSLTGGARFHNVTVMLRGLVGASPAAGASLVIHP